MGLLKRLPITPEGGMTISLINKTGAASVKGTVVKANSAAANSFVLIANDVPDPIGIVYEDGKQDGESCLVVVAGMADVLFIGSATAGHLARGFITGDAGYVSGRALSEAVPTSPFASDKHFYEIGHVLESRTGAGLARVLVHFN
jgi:hypothetical protein